MAGKQAMPTKAFDPKQFAQQVQKVRNNQKKNFHDWIERECKGLEKQLEPFAKGKVKKDKAVAEMAKLVKSEKKELDKLGKESRDKKHYAEMILALADDVPDDLDPKYTIIVTKLAEAGAGQAEDERRASVEQLEKTIKLIGRNQGQMAKVYGSEVADPITVLTLALALLLDYVSRKKK